MPEAIPLKVVDGAEPGEKKLAELGVDDTIPEIHLPNSVALDSELAAHTGNTNNPHQVTLAQLGGLTQAALDTHANNADLHRQIDDAAETAINLWSALKIKAAIQAKIDELVGSAPGALDTINELAAALGNDPNAITTLTNDIALKIPLTDRGAADGVCELVAGLVPLARMPFAEPVFGQYYAFDASEGVSTTTDDDNFHTKLQITTEDLPDSWYELHVTYGWNHDSTSSDFVGQVLQNGVQIGQLHKEEPKDSSGSWNNTGTNQRRYISRCFLLRLVGVHTFKLGYQTDDDDDESSIWDGLMRFFRVKLKFPKQI